MKPDDEAEYRDYVAARADRLRRYAYVCCGDWHLAEDVVQTALVRLYGAWSRAKRLNTDAYTRRIITNSLVDERRRAWFRRERVSDKVPDHGVGDVGEAVGEKLTLLSALFRLPKRQRAAIALRYLEDLPVEQTAHILNCSTGAVKSLTSRGLDTLRGLLGDEVPLSYQGVSS